MLGLLSHRFFFYLQGCWLQLNHQIYTSNFCDALDNEAGFLDKLSELNYRIKTSDTAPYRAIKYLNLPSVRVTPPFRDNNCKEVVRVNRDEVSFNIISTRRSLGGVDVGDPSIAFRTCVRMVTT